MEHQVGQTKDAGFQFGIRKTFPITSAAAWDFLFSAKGLNLWLGELETDFELKKEYQTKDGIRGVVRVFKPNSHIRINWQKSDWENVSTLQLRVIDKQNKTTLSFHHEQLRDQLQREEVKAYWNQVMDRITEEMGKATD